MLKDTRGDTQADDEVYNLIMKDKERLLSLDEPLRFIFSHSALREGWDNPNVFQICTLNETRSAMKKRQEIGRGLRLPVDQNGLRVFDESVNKLYVMANESYEDFARALQTEYEEDCGVTFGKVPLTALAKLTRVVDGKEQPIGREAAEVDSRGPGRAEDARRRRAHPAGLRPEAPGLQAGAARGAARPGAGRDRPAVVLPDRAAHPPGPGREAEPAQEGSHAQPRVPGAVGPHQAQDHLPGGVRDRRAGRPCRGCHQADGEDRGAARSTSPPGRLSVDQGRA